MVRSTAGITQIAQINIIAGTRAIVLSTIAGHTAATAAASAAHHRSRRVLMPQAAQLVAQDSRYGAHTGYIRFVAYALAEQTVPDFHAKMPGSRCFSSLM